MDWTADITPIIEGISGKPQLVAERKIAGGTEQTLEGPGYKVTISRKTKGNLTELQAVLVWSGSPDRLQGFQFSAIVTPKSGEEPKVNVPGPFWPTNYIRPNTPLSSLEGKSVGPHGSPDGSFSFVHVGNTAFWMDTRGETVCFPNLECQKGVLKLGYREARETSLAPGVRVESATLMVLQGQDFETAKKAYGKWCTQRYPLEQATPKWVKDMVLLELFPKDVGFKGIQKMLPTYKDIGFNTVYLMPHWKGTYSPIDLFAVEPKYGTEEELKDLIQACHKLGIRFLFDCVIHGFAKESPVLETHPEIFIRGDDGQFALHPTWRSVSTDWASPAYWNYVEKWVEHDVTTYDIDGYRVDAAGFKGPNWHREKAYESGSQSPVVMRHMLDALRRTKKDAVLLSEVFGPVFYPVCNLAHDNQTEGPQWFLEQVEQGKLDAEDYRLHLKNTLDLLPEGANRVYYTRNHDTSWFYHFNGYKPSFWAMEAVHAFCTIPSVFGGDTGNPPNPDADVWAKYKALFSARKGLKGKLDLAVPNDNRNVFVARRGERLFLISFSEEAQTVEASGRFRNPFTNNVRGDAKGKVSLQPYEVLIQEAAK